MTANVLGSSREYSKPNSASVNGKTHARVGGEAAAASVPNFLITRGAPSDHKAIYDLELRCFDPVMAFRDRQIKDLLRNPRADVWIMRYQSQIAAQAIILRRKFRDGIHARIYSLIVAPEFRGKGLSRNLLNHVLDGLRVRGIRNIYLEVESDAMIAIALYETLGFTQHHVLTDYYDVGRHGIKMRKILEE